MANSLAGKLERAREAVRAAESIVALAGVGICAESGIPAFRDAMTGLWTRFKPGDLATPEGFRRDPGTVWNWHAARPPAVEAARPNAGHRVLVALESACAARGAGFILITQNVDGLHNASGSCNVVELHGNIRRARCFDRGHPAASWEEGGALPPAMRRPTRRPLRRVRPSRCAAPPEKSFRGSWSDHVARRR
jgi:NAD-dependent deacetylase